MNTLSDNSSRIASWLNEHGDYLYGYAYSRLNGDAESAQDLVQETLISAWKSYGKFKGDSSERTWLVGIIKHKLLDHFRQMGRIGSLHEAVKSEPNSDWFDDDGKWHEAPKAWSSNPEALMENTEFYTTLNDCLEKLPDVQKRVFHLKELSGDSTQAICKELDISSSNFHVLMHRARNALRSCLDFNWFGR